MVTLSTAVLLASTLLAPTAALAQDKAVYGSMSGVVTNKDGRPIVGACVQPIPVTSYMTSNYWDTHSVKTDQRGKWSQTLRLDYDGKIYNYFYLALSKCEATDNVVDEYVSHVYIYSPDDTSDATVFRPRPHQNLRVNAQMLPRQIGAIAGSITDGNAIPMVGACVYATRSGFAYQARTDDHGHYLIPKAVTGTYYNIYARVGDYGCGSIRKRDVQRSGASSRNLYDHLKARAQVTVNFIAGPAYLSLP